MKPWKLIPCAASLAALLAAGCGPDRKSDFGGRTFCSSGEEPPKDTPHLVDLVPGKPVDTLRAATFNMSVGFPVAELIFTDLTVDTIAFKTLDTLHARYLRGQPAERLKAMARAIVDLNLDVVGLQEVETLSKNDTLDNDFLAELAADIQAIGGPAYQKRFLKLNDTILTGAKNGETIKVHFTEGDAMLVKPTYQVLDTADRIYFDLLPFKPPVYVQRGFNFARIKSPKGVVTQVYNTHLEVFTNYRNSQTGELKSIVACNREPGVAQIVLGDFNDTADSDTHLIMEEGGFYDTHLGQADTAWTTCCVAKSQLWLETATFSARRIDYIWTKGVAKVLEHRTALGETFKAADSTSLWPSDHRMVVSVLELQ